MSFDYTDCILELVERKLNVECMSGYDEERLFDIIEDSAYALAPDLAISDAAEFDWSLPSRERNLLVNRCFYEFNNALEQFAGDFADSIAKSRDMRLAEQYAEAKAAADEA